VGRSDRFSAGFDLRANRSGPEAARALVTAGGELFLDVRALLGGWAQTGRRGLMGKGGGDWRGGLETA
jgi:hypothetical protein